MKDIMANMDTHKICRCINNKKFQSSFTPLSWPIYRQSHSLPLDFRVSHELVLVNGIAKKNESLPVLILNLKRPHIFPLAQL